MSEQCKWLHERLEQLPIIKFPFELQQLPDNGIYFFYEEGEIWGHDDQKPRIVRIGTHKDGNFRNRIKEHFLLDESKMNFDKNKPAPHDRSIFRNHIGRALLNKENDEYWKIWQINKTPKVNRNKYKRDIEKERKIEIAVTKILRESFSFRFIIMDNQLERMGAKGLEGSLIGTVAHCKLCKQTSEWLGNYSPRNQVKESGLWLVQNLKEKSINDKEKEIILNALAITTNNNANL